VLIDTPWGPAEVVVAQGLDRLWYAVLRDPAPGGRLVAGGTGSSEQAAVDQLAAHCGRAPEERSA
jgi:hypothetical protein